MNYQGKPISSFFTSQLEAILAGLQVALDERNEVSKHPKFDKKGMAFPPPNPEFLKLKSAIEEEIESRKNA